MERFLWENVLNVLMEELFFFFVRLFSKILKIPRSNKRLLKNSGPMSLLKIVSQSLELGYSSKSNNGGVTEALIKIYSIGA